MGCRNVMQEKRKLNDNTNETTPLFFRNENRYVGGWKSTLKMAYHVEQTKMNSKRETMTTKQRDVGDEQRDVGDDGNRSLFCSVLPSPWNIG